MSESYKLCVVTTHPIQYMAPWFRSLAQEPALELDVVFLRELNPVQQGVGFGQSFQWDVPLRQGYNSQVLGVAKGFRQLPNLVFRLTKAIKASRPDAVLITGWNEPGLMAAYPLMKILGVPAIVSDRVGAKCIIEQHPGAGWIVSGNKEGLKSKIIELAANRGMLTVASVAAREAAKDYSWESYRVRVVRSLEHIYEQHEQSLQDGR